jgi:ketosteroid isomerase-like protein
MGSAATVPPARVQHSAVLTMEHSGPANEHYRAMCVDCHGAPGVDRGEFGEGMTPPPDLTLTGEKLMHRGMLAVAVAVFASPVNGQQADSTQEAEVRAVVEGFHSALEAGDSTVALGHLHPDVSIHEGGQAETLADYRSGHLRGDIAFASATNREITDSAITVWGDQALYTSVSRTTGQYRGREIDSSGTETMVLVRTAEGWRIRHIHWSSR